MRTDRCRRWWIALPALLAAISGCAGSRQETGHGADAPHGASAASGQPVLHESLGTYSYRITVASPEGQRWFDQGLRLVYAFNHHEAQKAFEEAARIDPKCAMCFWGIAVSEGSNYNDPTDAD